MKYVRFSVAIHGLNVGPENAEQVKSAICEAIRYYVRCELQEQSMDSDRTDFRDFEGDIEVEIEEEA